MNSRSFNRTFGTLLLVIARRIRLCNGAVNIKSTTDWKFSEKEDV